MRKAGIKLIVLVILLLAKDNGKLIQKSKSGFKRIKYWNKEVSKLFPRLQSIGRPFICLHFLCHTLKI